MVDMRVIQDSEDEEDLEEEKGDAVPNSKGDASKDDPSTQHEERSTGSTCMPSSSVSYTYKDLTGFESDDPLLVQQEAHRAHYSGASAHQNAPHSSSLAGHANKRRKTSSDAAVAESPRVSSAKKKAPVTYGKSRTMSSGPVLEHTLTESTVILDKPWDLQGTMGEHWQYHEPMGMFAEPLSTIPYATATQQQIFQEIMVPEILGLEPEPDMPRYEPAKSSIPWSQFLKSSSEQIPDESNQTSQSVLLSGQQESSHDHQDFVAGAEISPAVTSASQLSRSSRRESITRLKTSLKGSPLRNEVLQNNNELSEAMAPLALPMVGPQIETGLDATPTRKKRKPVENPSASSEPRKSPRRHQKSEGDTIEVPSSTKGPHKSSSVPNSEDDLIDIGIPKEHYQPRPSRSRSLKHTPEATVDYSIRPEKAARKPRRSKTSSAIEDRSRTTTPEKIQQICDMGFTPSSTQRALKRNNGDMTSSVDWLIANGMAEDELAPPRTLKAKNVKADKEHSTPHIDNASNSDSLTASKRERRVSFNEILDTEVPSAMDAGAAPEDGPVDEPTLPVLSKSPKVSVVIPRSKTQKSPSKSENSHQLSPAAPKRKLSEVSVSKSQRRQDVLGQPEPLLEQSSIIDDAVEAPPTKEKKKRGRPKKAVKSLQTVPEVQFDDSNPQSIGTDTAVPDIHTNASASVGEPIAVVQENHIEEPGVQEIAAPVEQSVPVLPTDAAPTVSPKEGSSTPRKPSKAEKPVQTPIAQSKVRYRVGLSKHARVAPLLRSVKK
jgi:hypothetical protein